MMWYPGSQVNFTTNVMLCSLRQVSLCSLSCHLAKGIISYHLCLCVGETRGGWVGRQLVVCEGPIQTGGMVIIIPQGLASLARQADEGGQGQAT